MPSPAARCCTKESEREARRWYLQALDDRRFAEWLLQQGRFYDKGCFMSQQAGEKALKSCLYASGSRRVFGRSLFDACSELAARSSLFAALEEAARPLDRYCIPTRYPNGLPGGMPFQSYSKRDLEDALADLKTIFDVCAEHLSACGVDIA